MRLRAEFPASRARMLSSATLHFTAVAEVTVASYPHSTCNIRPGMTDIYEGAQIADMSSQECARCAAVCCLSENIKIE